MTEPTKVTPEHIAGFVEGFQEGYDKGRREAALHLRELAKYYREIDYPLDATCVADTLTGLAVELEKE